MSTEPLGTTATAQPAPWIPDDSTFGARLALVRQRMGWGNVKEAALACGEAPESWRTWERDNVNPRKLIEICRRIATRTGCDYGWLVDGPALAGRSTVQTKAGTLRLPDRPIDNRPSGRPDRSVTTPIGPRRTRRLPHPGQVSPGRRAA
jgi:hypothetical protein